MKDSGTEKHIESSAPLERQTLTVVQPKPIQSLLEDLNVIGKIAERVGEDNSGGDRNGAAGTGGATGSTATLSPREDAIAHLPPVEEMQGALGKEIQKEVRALEKRIGCITALNKPGAANQMTLLYAKIRSLNGLLSELVNASVDAIRRLYIRIFIDKQAIVE